MQSQHNFPVKIAKIHAVFAIEIGTRQLPSSLQDFEAEYPSCETLDAFSRLATSVNYSGRQLGESCTNINRGWRGPAVQKSSITRTDGSRFL